MRLRKNTPAQNFVRDLTAPLLPLMVARNEAIRVEALARVVFAAAKRGPAAERRALTAVRAELRGAA